MEFERFYYFGSDPIAAKWYLLTGSCLVPQRLLCLKEYATHKKFVNFGRFVKYSAERKKDLVYCYVIKNIFDIPFNDLGNFFFMTCGDNTGSEMITDRYDMSQQQSDKDTLIDLQFKKTFQKGKSQEFPNINIKTNPEVMSSGYLSGLENIVPEVDWNLDMTVMPCTEINTNTHVSGPNNEYMDVNFIKKDTYIINKSGNMKTPLGTCKRRTTEMPDDPKRRYDPSIRIMENIVINDRNNVIGEPMDESDSFMCNTDIENNAFPSDGPLNIANNINYAVLPQQDVYYQYNIEKPQMNVTLNRRALTNLGNEIRNSTTNNWFDSDFTECAKVSDNFIVFVSRTDDNVEIDRYELHADVISKLTVDLRSQLNVYPTFVSPQNKSEILHNLAANVDADVLFENMVEELGKTVISIVESDSVEDFLMRVKSTNEPALILLYGLFTYMKSQKELYTTFMENICSLAYIDNRLRLLSDLYVKIYFKAKYGKKLKINLNTVNLYHLQRITLPDSDIKNLNDLKVDPTVVDLLTDLTNNVGTKNTFSIDINSMKITGDSVFCNNMFAIDQFMQYIYNEYNGSVYLSTFSTRLSKIPVPEVYRRKYANTGSNLFESLQYRGIVTLG